jgi:hypothetical protein
MGLPGLRVTGSHRTVSGGAALTGLRRERPWSAAAATRRRARSVAAWSKRPSIVHGGHVGRRLRPHMRNHLGSLYPALRFEIGIQIHLQWIDSYWWQYHSWLIPRLGEFSLLHRVPLGYF